MCLCVVGGGASLGKEACALPFSCWPRWDHGTSVCEGRDLSLSGWPSWGGRCLALLLAPGILFSQYVIIARWWLLLPGFTHCSKAISFTRVQHTTKYLASPAAVTACRDLPQLVRHNLLVLPDQAHSSLRSMCFAFVVAVVAAGADRVLAHCPSYRECK